MPKLFLSLTLILSYCGGGGGDGNSVPPFLLYSSVAVGDLNETENPT